MESEEKLIAKCKELVEQKLGWGGSHIWNNQDFESLSKAIFEKTNVTLSISTLKRIWGKVKYDSAPTPTTLNTLAQFLGFEHWRAFRQEQLSENILPDILLEKSALKKKSNLLFFLIFGLSLFSFMLFKGKIFKKEQEESTLLNAEKFKFKARKIVPNSIPNSVVFDYDASASPSDSVFIQQTWDARLTKQVSKKNSQHTSLYYYPGFFKAKLLVGKQIVKETEVFIKTDGWLPLIRQEKVPIYIKKEDVFSNGKMGLSIEALKAKNVTPLPDAPIINFLNYRDFEVSTDNFEFETSLKNNYFEGSSACQKTGITIMCKNSLIYIPLSIKGCVSDNNLFCLEQSVKGTEHDLSGFGVDFTNFVKIKLKVANGKADFFVNEKPAYHLDKIESNSPIVGIIYRFQGAGTVDFVKLSDGKGKIVYEEQF